MTNTNGNDIISIDKEEITIEKADDIRVQLRNEPEVQNIARQIDAKNQLELLEYGKQPAVEISKFSDRILSMMRSTSVTDSGTMLTQLGKIMDRFDKNDFDEPKGGLLSKIFKRGGSMIEKIFSKYQTLGAEIEKINVEISKYKDEMTKSTVTLEEMYEHNIQYYMELEKYVVAGQMKIEELKQLVPSYEEKAAGETSWHKWSWIRFVMGFKRLKSVYMILIWHGWWHFKRHRKSVCCSVVIRN